LRAPYAEFAAKLVPLKAKMWQGMAPISRDRWLQKKMDDPANWRTLMEVMDDIFLLYRWYNLEVVQTSMRAGFNFMVDKYVGFAGALNDRREKNGVSERLDLAAMWAEYFSYD
jgi:hypothetical protein